MYIGDIDSWRILEAVKVPQFDELTACLIEKANSISAAGWPVGLEAAMLPIKGMIIHPGKIGIAERNVLGRYIENREYNPQRYSSYTEIAAFRMWKRRLHKDISVNDLCDSSYILSGFRSFRTKPSQTAPLICGSYRQYLHHHLIVERINNLLAQINATNWPSTFLCAIAAYLDVLFIHPFSDGNGRLARLIFQTVLHTRGGLVAPVLPIAPIICANRKLMLDCYGALQKRDNPYPLIKFFAEALNMSARYRDMVI